MNELEESKLRSKVMLLLYRAHFTDGDKSTRIKRIINQFTKCIKTNNLNYLTGELK
jgi:hypothetical protein